ncbi:MAG: type I restriction enzyme HsdR N-terminal domain-containing protein [Deltaproteobacteria bacterium]|nr:type I restriction enzyme HsdR N-terminal domain-containing protein [Deltaproteobacteria bacterium]
MSETCPGEKYKAGLIALSECETGKEEVIREKILQLLLREKGFRMEDLELDVPYEFQTGGDVFQSRASIIIRLEVSRVVLIKCGAGSILARERPSLSLARLMDAVQIPLTVVTNSEDAVLLNTLNGETLECGLGAIPTRTQLLERLPDLEFIPLPEKRLQMEKRILSAFEALGLHGECH